MSADESSEYLTTQLLTYLGNKRALLPFLGAGVESVKKSLGKERLTFFDAFSGSGIVSRYMKRHASLIVANDLERYSEVVNRCYLTNRADFDEKAFDAVFREWVGYTRTHLAPGSICSLYAPRDDAHIQKGERAFYTRENAILLDSARRALDAVVPARYFNLVLAPLLTEASIHTNTAGVFKGFYKDRRGVGTFGGEGRNALSRICGKVELQKPVLCGVDDNEADFVHMGVKKNMTVSGSSFFEGDHVSHFIDAKGGAKGPGSLHNRFSYFPFVAGCAV